MFKVLLLSLILSAGEEAFQPKVQQELAASVLKVVGAVVNPNCDSCKESFLQVKQMFECPEVIKEVHERLDLVYSLSKDLGFEKECNEALVEPINKVLTYISETTLGAFCASIRMCEASPEVSSPRPASVVSLFDSLVSQLPGDDLCDECMSIADEFKERSEDKELVKFHEELESHCDSLKIVDAQLCKKVLNQSFDMLIKFLTAHKSQQICSMFKMC